MSITGLLSGGGAIIGDIVGGLIGGAQNRQSARAAADLQREFAQHGVQWRVEDAKRAKLHPLAALGMMPSHAQPIALGDTLGPALQSAGQDLRSAMQSGLSEEERELHDLNSELIKANTQKVYTETAKIASDMALDHQARTATGPALGIQNDPYSSIIGQVTGVSKFGDTPMAGTVKLDAPTMYTNDPGRPHVIAGKEQGMVSMIMPWGEMLLPSGKNQESGWEQWNSMPAYEKWGWILHNARQNPGFLRNYLGFQMMGLEGGNSKPFIDNKPLSGGVNDAIQRAMKEIYRRGPQPKKWRGKQN